MVTSPDVQFPDSGGIHTAINRVTRKDENLTGVKLLVLQPIGADGANVGRTLVAVDAAGAGESGDGGRRDGERRRRHR